MSFDADKKSMDARQRLPLERLLQQHGFGPSGSGTRWNSFKCPFCGNKSASLFHPRNAPGDVKLFKCFYTGGKEAGPCPTGGKSLDEAGFLAAHLGCARREGWVAWLKEAGVWSAERLSPSVLPGARARKKREPVESDGKINRRDTEDTEKSGGGEGIENRELRIENFESGEGEENLVEPGTVDIAREANGPAQGVLPHNNADDAQVSSNPQGASGPENAEGGPISNLPASAGEGSPPGESSTPALSQESAGRPLAEGEGVSGKGRGRSGDGKINHRDTEDTEKREAEKVFEEQLVSAAHGIIEALLASAPILERRLGVSAEVAAALLAELQKRGMLGEADGSGAHKILIASKSTAEMALSLGRNGPAEGLTTEARRTQSSEGNGEGENGGPPDGGDENGAADGEEPKRSDDELAFMALREFYDGLQWRPADEELMWQKRGILPATCRMAGLRSSGPENEAALRALSKKYSLAVLCKAGLWKFDEEEQRANPERQFCGWGIVGKVKRKDRKEREGEGELEWGQCNPVLIPYWDAHGKLVGLRPHKGGGKGQRAKLYVVRGESQRLVTAATANAGPNKNGKRVVICEGEFKALAVWQVFNLGTSGEWRGASSDGRVTNAEVECCAVPGISMGKNKAVQMEIRDWLRSLGRVKEILVGFDSEEKSDPKLPMYKEDPWKRHDTEVYARFLAGWLRGQAALANRTGVIFLPKEWRDEKGKADWDGALVRMLRGELKIANCQLQIANYPNLSGGLEVVMGFWGSWRVEIRKAFDEVLRSAIGPDEYASGTPIEQEDFFYDSAPRGTVGIDGHDEGERIVKNLLERKRHEPLLPFGDDAELELKRKFMRLGFMAGQELAPELRDWQGRAKTLAKQFEDVLGWYYKRVPKAKPSKEELLSWAAGRRMADEHGKQTGNWDWVTFFEEYQKGAPVGVADFKMDCRFVLVKTNGDRVRMVTLKNGIDKTGLVELGARAFTSARDFKEWVCNKGNFTWMTGDTEREMLQHDINHRAAHLTVYELGWFGWNEDALLWVADDCAITPLGSALKPDPQGIIWWRGMGYLMGGQDIEGEEFKQGRPRWRPDEGLRIKQDHPEVKYGMEPGEDDAAAVVGLFVDLTQRLQENQCGKGQADVWEGNLILGSVLAFAAAPEFFKRENYFGSIWLHGERGGGKSSMARWLMNVWGMAIGDETGGTKLTDSTAPGLKIIMQQYSNLPVWFEEAKRDLDPVKAEFLKSPYNREVSAKKEFGGKSRRIRTNPIVTGEVTSSDSATRQRYVHTQVSPEKRYGSDDEQKKNFEWFQENKDFFLSWRGRCCARAGRTWSGSSIISEHGKGGRNCATPNRGRAGCTGLGMRAGWRRPTPWAGAKVGKDLPNG